MTRLLVCDLDGTLCDDSHRRALAKPGSWDQYHERMGNDTPCDAVATIVTHWIVCGHEVLFLTGRPERYRERTVQWLSLNGIGSYHYHLLMRPDENRERTEVFKVRALKAFLQQMPRFEVSLILEDRSRLVNVFRQLGYPTFQVAENNT